MKAMHIRLVTVIATVSFARISVIRNFLKYKAERKKNHKRKRG